MSCPVQEKVEGIAAATCQCQNRVLWARLQNLNIKCMFNPVMQMHGWHAHCTPKQNYTIQCLLSISLIGTLHIAIYVYLVRRQVCIKNPYNVGRSILRRKSLAIGDT